MLTSGDSEKYVSKIQRLDLRIPKKRRSLEEPNQRIQGLIRGTEKTPLYHVVRVQKVLIRPAGQRGVKLERQA